MTRFAPVDWLSKLLFGISPTEMAELGSEARERRLVKTGAEVRAKWACYNGKETMLSANEVRRLKK